eukprot:5280499-Amphidinium_carterae.2
MAKAKFGHKTRRRKANNFQDYPIHMPEETLWCNHRIKIAHATTHHNSSCAIANTTSHLNMLLQVYFLLKNYFWGSS